MPQFPDFKLIDINDRDQIKDRFWQYQSKTSEINFTNLFIWRTRYNYSWSLLDDDLLIISDQGPDSFALQPIGGGDIKNAASQLFEWMRSEKEVKKPMIQRADQRFVDSIGSGYAITEKRDHFDYIYKRSSLVELAGNRYHSKRNHINALKKEHHIEYREFDESGVKACTELVERWCGLRRCEEDMNLLSEWDAVAEALANFRELRLSGGILSIDGQVEAFTLGEMLNLDTLVIHVEKANPEIRGSYAMINQKFAETITEAVFVNREQDLGELGLRQAKMSYYPYEFIKKYSVSENDQRSST